MFEKVKKILVDELNVDESKVTPEASIKGDLGADSIDILQLLMTLEEESGITIPDEKLATFETVGDIVIYLEIALMNRGNRDFYREPSFSGRLVFLYTQKFKCQKYFYRTFYI